MLFQNPAVIEFEEMSSCNCFCQDSIVSIKIVLPVSGYCPGQMMQIKVDARNDSSVEVRKIIFQLVRVICFLIKLIYNDKILLYRQSFNGSSILCR